MYLGLSEIKIITNIETKEAICSMCPASFVFVPVIYSWTQCLASFVVIIFMQCPASFVSVFIMRANFYLHVRTTA